MAVAICQHCNQPIVMSHGAWVHTDLWESVCGLSIGMAAPSLGSLYPRR